MGLGGYDGQLTLGRTVFVHVVASSHRVEIHENGVSAGFFRLDFGAFLLCFLLFSSLLFFRKFRHPFHHFLDIGPGHETAHNFDAVLIVKLLRSDGEDTVEQAGLDGSPRPVERGASAGARVFDVGNGNLIETVCGERHLSANRMLERVHSPAGVRKPRGFDIVTAQPAVLENKFERLSRHLFDTFVKVFPELYHPDSDDIDVVSHLLPLFPLSMIRNIRPFHSIKPWR